MGLRNFTGTENVYELYFITFEEAHSKPVFLFYICINTCGPQGCPYEICGLLWVEYVHLCFKKWGGIKE